MARVHLQFPEGKYYSFVIQVRITDLNYGNHVGNDSFLTLMHEARIQFLGKFGWSEMNLGGTGIIMADAALQFKKELGYGNSVVIDVAVDELSRLGFDLYYRIRHRHAVDEIYLLGKTGIVCFDYDKKKVSPLPDGVREAFAKMIKVE